MRFLKVCTAAVLCALAVRPVAAEEKPSWAGRFLYSGEITGNFSPEDRGYFNELEYQRSLLRLIRFNFALEFQASDHVTLLTEIRSDNFDVPEPYALYVRVRPWTDRAFDIQAGRIPPVFGAFARRRYDIDNPLIGYPLMYQYPTTVRADAAPTELDELLGQRGWGVKNRYSIGPRRRIAGLPMINSLRWDTGVQIKLGRDPVELGVAATQGTISNPRIEDDNSGKQVAGRVGFRPAFGWRLGFSAARGEYLAGDVSDALGDTGHQTAWGVDLEFGKDHFLLRAESMRIQWDRPALGTNALGGLGFLVEASYKFTPGFYAAARVDRLRFDHLPEAVGGATWDSSITRIEVGGGYYFHRQLLAKVSFQYNERDAGPRTTSRLPNVQLLFWF